MSAGRKPGRRPNPPQPERRPGQGALPFVILSVVTSFAFIYYGMSVLSAGEVPRWLAAFAWVTAGYGVLNLAVLSCAHASRAPWCVSASQVIAICYLGAFVVDTFAGGLDSGLQLGGILLVGLVLWCNWVAVTRLVARGG